MAARYLLDTNIASYVIKNNFPAVRRHLTCHPMADIAISSITEGELSFGVARKPDALPWDSNAARQYGELRAALEQLGKSLGSLCMMIGAHALSEGLILVTHDRAFGRIPETENSRLDQAVVTKP